MYIIQGHYWVEYGKSKFLTKGLTTASDAPSKELGFKLRALLLLYLTYFPIVFVYSMTTWAIWLQVKLALEYKETTLRGIPSRTLCLIIGYWLVPRLPISVSGSRPLHPPQLVILSRRVYWPRLSQKASRCFGIRLPPHSGTIFTRKLDCQINRSGKIPQEMSDSKAGSNTSLLNMWTMRI